MIPGRGRVAASASRPATRLGWPDHARSAAGTAQADLERRERFLALPDRGGMCDEILGVEI
jgi:hypothetical protein